MEAAAVVLVTPAAMPVPLQWPPAPAPAPAPVPAPALASDCDILDNALQTTPLNTGRPVVAVVAEHIFYSF